MKLLKPLSRSLLRTELAMRLELEALADQHFDWVAASLEANPAATEGMIAAALARDADRLELEAQAAMVRGRQESRNGAWLIFLPFLESVGVVGATRRPTDEYDGAKASFASRGLAIAYLAIVQAALAQWRSGGKEPGELAKAIREHRARMPSAIERTASTENTEAFNHELLTQGGGSGDGDGGTAPRRPIQWTWSAVLDRAVCRRCAALHGQTVPDGAYFELDGLKYWPPVHPRCRCIAIPSALPWTAPRHEVVGRPDEPPPWHTDNVPRQRGPIVVSPGAAVLPHEMPTYEYLASQGNHVRVLPRAGHAKSYDAFVNGAATEITKAHGEGPRNLYQRIQKKLDANQARHVIVDARDNGSTYEQTRAALSKAHTLLTGARGKVVRVIGTGFDITYTLD